MKLECNDCDASFDSSLADSRVSDESCEFWGALVTRGFLVWRCPICNSEEVFEEKREVSNVECPEETTPDC